MTARKSYGFAELVGLFVKLCAPFIQAYREEFPARKPAAVPTPAPELPAVQVQPEDKPAAVKLSPIPLRVIPAPIPLPVLPVILPSVPATTPANRSTKPAKRTSPRKPASARVMPSAAQTKREKPKPGPKLSPSDFFVVSGFLGNDPATAEVWTSRNYRRAADAKRCKLPEGLTGVRIDRFDRDGNTVVKGVK